MPRPRVTIATIVLAVGVGMGTPPVMTTAAPAAADRLVHKRPVELRVGNAPPASRLRCDLLADHFEPLRPATIYGCRNGGFCGVLMAGSTEEIKGLRAAVGEVTGPGGKWYGWKEDRYYATFPLADAAMGGRRAG